MEDQALFSDIRTGLDTRLAFLTIATKNGSLSVCLLPLGILFHVHEAAAFGYVMLCRDHFNTSSSHSIRK